MDGSKGQDVELIEKPSLSKKRILLIMISLGGLSMVFLFQQTDLVSLVAQDWGPNLHFAINRAIRLLLNDICMLIFLIAWFNDRSISKLALVIQGIDFFVLLPVYLYFKLSLEGDSEISSPLLSQFHRLIVNPTLMILLIPAVYFQRFMKQK